VLAEEGEHPADDTARLVGVVDGVEGVVAVGMVDQLHREVGGDRGHPRLLGRAAVA
jgi:hypothetical protein